MFGTIKTRRIINQLVPSGGPKVKFLEGSLVEPTNRKVLHNQRKIFTCEITLCPNSTPSVLSPCIFVQLALVFFPSFSFSFNYSPSHLYCPLSGLSVCWVLWERGLWEVPASGCGDVQRQRAAQRVKVSWQDNRIVCSQQVIWACAHTTGKCIVSVNRRRGRKLHGQG